MKKNLYFLICLTLVISLLAGSTSAFAGSDDDKKKEDTTFKVYWKDGIRLDSADKNFKLKIGGRIQNDWLWGSTEDGIEAAFGDIVAGNEFRRARLYASGTIYNNIEFKAQYDFAGGDVDMKDVYLGLKGLPFGAIKVGHFKAGFGMNELTSSKYITFMERALPMAFVPSRETGVAINGAAGESKKENVTWNFGLFTDADDYGDAKAHDNAYIMTGRLTFLPYSEGKDLLHLGAGVMYRDIPEGTTYRFRQRAEAHLLPRYVETPKFQADSFLAFNAEAAAVFGSFHAAGEFVMVNSDAPEVNDPSFSGFYVYGGYYLTGESRAYKTTAGAFDRTKVNAAFDGEGGMGAWEVALRYSQIDLTDEGIIGGEMKDITAALNWYLNNNTAIKFNYVRADRDDIKDGVANILQMRFQVDF